MTREHQVQAALELLLMGRKGNRAACKASVENAVDFMVDMDVVSKMWRAKHSKAAQKATRTYHQALRRLQVAHKALLAAGGRVPSGLDLTRIETLQVAHKALAAGGRVPDLLDLTSIETAIKATEPQRYKVLYRTGPKEEFAVRLAYELLMKWWGSEEFITTTRKGPWWKLSAILYGNSTYDLFRHLRAFKCPS
jgi:hypothetical protein